MDQGKRIIIICYCSLYFFFFFGLLFHTSRHPLLFGKYSPLYFAGIILLALLFFPLLYFVPHSFKKRIIRIGKKKIRISPLNNCILIFFVSLLSLIIPSEIVLRHKYQNVEQNSYKYTIKSFHPFLQSQLTPEDGIHVNTEGFRGEEIAIKKPQDSFRIVLLGGSTVLNREVSYEKNASRLLEKKLQKKFSNKKIQVINAGKDGYNSEHSLIQYLFNLKDFKPDLVIMWHGINDLYTSCTPTDTQYGSFKRDYSHSFGAIARMAFFYFRPQPIVSVKLVSIDFFLQFIKDNLYSDITRAIREERVNHEAFDYLYNSKDFITVHNFPSLATYKRNILSLIEILHGDNVPLILGNQPSLYKSKMTLNEAKLAVLPSLVCRKNGKYYSLDSITYGINSFNSATKFLAEENNVGFIDLDKNVPKTTDYFVDTVHYTEKGNAAIANALFSYVLSHDYIK